MRFFSSISMKLRCSSTTSSSSACTWDSVSWKWRISYGSKEYAQIERTGRGRGEEERGQRGYAQRRMRKERGKGRRKKKSRKVSDKIWSTTLKIFRTMTWNEQDEGDNTICHTSKAKSFKIFLKKQAFPKKKIQKPFILPEKKFPWTTKRKWVRAWETRDYILKCIERRGKHSRLTYPITTNGSGVRNELRS